jgi:hypothetical protein
MKYEVTLRSATLGDYMIGRHTVEASSPSEAAEFAVYMTDTSSDWPLSDSGIAQEPDGPRYWTVVEIAPGV